MKRILFLSFAFISFWSSGADPKYPVSEIPEEMKKDCYAVVRESEDNFEIFSLGRTVRRVRKVVTILGKGGSPYAFFSEWYDKDSKILSFKAVAYDAAGQVIRKLKQSEIRDQSYISAGALFDDNRIKSADLAQATFPYTVEFEYEKEIRFLYWIPDYFVYEDDEVSILQSSFSLSYPLELKPRYRTYKVDEPTVSKLADGRVNLRWSFTNIKPEKFERIGPGKYQNIPNIQLFPTTISYGGYTGRMDTWSDYAAWLAQLLVGRQTLPDATIQKVKGLVAGLKTNEEKVKVVYEYMQSKTRYVGIQLGIGGLQPFPASTVDEVGYGDCKALSNYCIALLGAVGIPAHYALIWGGPDPNMNADFPGDYFNHVVAAVPNGPDTIWLECTSQTNPYGYAGRFTGDRKSLLIAGNGGKLVSTPRYSMEQNLQTRTVEATIESSGDGMAKATTQYRGLQYENDGLSFKLNESAENQKKWLTESTEIPSFDLVSFEMKDFKGRIPKAVVSQVIRLKKYASLSGKRMFLVANLMNRSSYIPDKVDKRRTEIVNKFPFVDVDTIRYSFLDNLYPEFVPEPVHYTSRFGEYEASYKIEQGKLVYIRRFKMTGGVFAPESYPEYTEFFRNVNKADNQKVVFLNKT